MQVNMTRRNKHRGKVRLFFFPQEHELVSIKQGCQVLAPIIRKHHAPTAICTKWDRLKPLISYSPTISHSLLLYLFPHTMPPYHTLSANQSYQQQQQLPIHAMVLAEADFVVVVLYLPQKDHLLHAIPPSPKSPLLFPPCCCSQMSKEVSAVLPFHYF